MRIFLISLLFIIGCDFVSPEPEKPVREYAKCSLEQMHTMTPYIFGVSCSNNISEGDTVVIGSIDYSEYDRLK